MQLDQFQFNLPSSLIAQYPLENRSDSKLLCYDRLSDRITDKRFVHVTDLLNEGDLLVLNNTQVIPARLLGHKRTGGKVEILIERVLGVASALAHMKSNRPIQVGTEIWIDGVVRVLVTDKKAGLFKLMFVDVEDIWQVLNEFGQIPLPPYMKRSAEKLDLDRYQTVFACQPGAIAAPTAGLHFDERLLQTLDEKGIEIVFVTLQVGAGTFKPVRVNNIHEHVMHSEYIDVPETVCDAIKRIKNNGKRVIAVGTTVVRSLETAALSGALLPFQGDTDIFIYPGFEFRVVDALITNFHLPGSTLLMLVSAFAGRRETMAAYQHAIQQRYRFYSYGDAMFIG